MRKRIPALLSFAFAVSLAVISFRTLQGQSGVSLNKLPTGVVAAHLVGRLVGVDGDFQLIGYFGSVEGVNLPLFAGDRGERTARLSFRSEPFRLTSTPNGAAFQISRTPSPDGSGPVVNLYLNLAPDRDFDRPESFSDGLLVGVMRSHGMQGILVPGQMFKLDGTVEVVSATPLPLGTQVVNFTDIVDTATVSFAGVPPSSSEFQENSSYSIPFSATVVTAGSFRAAQ